MESSNTFKRISSANRDIEKIPAPLRSHISSPKSPNLSPIWSPSTPRASCLFNYPGENQFSDSKWPGQLMSLDEQCKRDGGTGACQ
ncbi:hypothetical protein AVEN_1699-1, partial [Araneus ventricosus]